MSKKILFLTYSPLFSKGGGSKNFLNLVKHLGSDIIEHQYKPYIISFNNNHEDLIATESNILKYDHLNLYNIKLVKRTFPSGKILFQALEYLINILKSLLLIIRFTPDIVYAYSDKTLYLFFAFKYVFRYRFIYDMRGDVQNELKVQGASNIYLKLIKTLNKLAFKSVNIIFTVTSESKPTNKVTCIPKYNFYDGDIFYYNEEEAIEKKKNMNLENKFVFVYTGNAHYYQFLDGTIDFFSQFFRRHSNSFLLVITEYEAEIFDNLLRKYQVPDTAYLIKGLQQDKISEIQQIADMAFLLREDLPLNHHSFPTKFAEYLATGVPVLMTPHIHSITPIVLNNRLGEVINVQQNYFSTIDKIYDSYLSNLEVKKRCSEYAKRELMWQKKAKDIFNILISN